MERLLAGGTCGKGTKPPELGLRYTGNQVRWKNNIRGEEFEFSLMEALIPQEWEMKRIV